ncbi:Na(+)/H(+) antiporter subunit D [Paraglaciecola aquimarina]|uniref:Na(+)/H(+) antiporter subunit D n=1 Tax=Paraglaciecola aquimarina TaxID=1235557 RepID=A0ABU3SSR0_9ALTE|nr:Na(+)/H(+) antiporter subunit D [Paraglaciecola aquimarina]MDU0353007.1 Na(+)/H(+) antiporter subunit D [Paraglaciecola aquimarina]
MGFDLFPPALVLLIAAGLIGLLKGHARTSLLLLAPIITLWAIWQIPDGVQSAIKFLTYTIEPIEGSPVRRLFATVFAIMVLVGGIYSFRVAKWYELAAAYAYAGGAIGVCFAGDLITMFIYWELMAIFSTIVVFCGATARARAAGIRYGIMHLLGGVILQIGIVGVVINTGSIEIQPMLASDFSTWMILIGVLINAAAPPVSSWLADAYPEATPTGSVFLSAFTTKTAVLVLILLFPGESTLIGLGLFMVMYGIIFALLENDVRRILAYSVVNQVGFMVVAVGIGTEMALNGATAHAFAHIVYKALLFMSAGAVIYRTGKNKCIELGGLFRTMPLTCVCGIIGALAISSFPLTSGFTTKSMISQAAVDMELVWVYMALTAASAGVFLHAGIKFPWFVFFQKDSGLRPKDAPWNMSLAMVIFSGVCILLGVFPELLYGLLPYPVDYVPYKIGKVLFYLQLLLFSGLAFFVLLPLMKRTLTISLDIDWLWRRAGYSLLKIVDRMFSAIGAAIGKQRIRIQAFSHLMAIRYLGQPHTADSKERGMFARSWPIGTTALWIAVLLSVYVLLYYL